MQLPNASVSSRTHCTNPSSLKGGTIKPLILIDPMTFDPVPTTRTLNPRTGTHLATGRGGRLSRVAKAKANPLRLDFGGQSRADWTHIKGLAGDRRTFKRRVTKTIS